MTKNISIPAVNNPLLGELMRRIYDSEEIEALWELTNSNAMKRMGWSDHGQVHSGDETPIDIEIMMNNSAGLFQVDELLKEKLKGSGIEKYVEVRAYVTGETKKKLIIEFVAGK